MTKRIVTAALLAIALSASCTGASPDARGTVDPPATWPPTTSAATGRAALGLSNDAEAVARAERETAARQAVNPWGVLLSDAELAAMDRHQQVARQLEQAEAAAPPSSPLVGYRMSHDLLDLRVEVLVSRTASAAEVATLVDRLSAETGVAVEPVRSRLTRAERLTLGRELADLDQRLGLRPFAALEERFGVRVEGWIFDPDREEIRLQADQDLPPRDPGGLEAAAWPALVAAVPALAVLPPLPVVVEPWAPTSLAG